MPMPTKGLQPAMASFKFGSSAFNSPVGQRIEKVTNSGKASEDWALIIEICDIINETDEGPKDAVKAIKKRLGNTKNYKSILYTLTLTEACVKNCGKRFHMLISSKDFLNDMTKILTPKGPKADKCPQVVQEKILSLIQSWADAFRNAPDLQQVVVCYENLKAEGFEFPAQDLDTLSPIYTPSRSVSEDASAVPKPATDDTDVDGEFLARHRVSRNSSNGQQPAQTGPVQPSAESMGKLRSQLDVVEENVRVMSEMLVELSEVEPSARSEDDLLFLKELNRTCRLMQERVVDLVGKIANEEVTGELLRINDDLNNVFLRYDRFERPYKERAGWQDEAEQKTSQSTAVATAATDNAFAASAKTEETTQQPLIDFNDITPELRANEPAKARTADDDDFDMFAQSRSSTFEASRISGSTYDDNSSGVPLESSIASAMNSKGPYPKLPSPVPVSAVPEKAQEEKSMDEDIEDVEEWLKDTDLSYLEQHMGEEPKANATKVQDSSQVSSAEFDRFLSERATLGAQRSTSTHSSGAVPRQMDMMAGEKRNDPYAL